MMKFLTRQEVADFLRISTRTVSRWIQAGKLRAYRPGRAYLIKEDDLIKFFEGTSNNA